MISVKRLTNDEVRAIQEQVRRRDGDRCLLHGTTCSQVHEIKQKSSSAKNAAGVYQIPYMACVCADCHYGLHHGGRRNEVTLQLLKVLRQRYGYRYPKSVWSKFSAKAGVRSSKIAG